MDCIEKAFAFNPRWVYFTLITEWIIIRLETKKHMDYVRVVIGALNIRVKDIIPWCD